MIRSSHAVLQTCLEVLSSSLLPKLQIFVKLVTNNLCARYIVGIKFFILGVSDLAVQLRSIARGIRKRTVTMLQKLKPRFCYVVHRSPKYLSLIHISEPTRLGMTSYAVFCLKKKT